MIYRWMNKPVMDLFRQTAVILKLSEKHKGPSRSLHGVRTEIPALTFYVVSQITVENSSQPKTCGTKWKSLSKQIDFFFYCGHKSDENPVEEVQSPKMVPNLPKSINS